MDSCSRVFNPRLKCIRNFRCVSRNNIIDNELILGDICNVPGAKKIVCLDLVREYPNYPCLQNYYWIDGKSLVVFNGCGGLFNLCYTPATQTKRTTTAPPGNRNVTSESVNASSAQQKKFQRPSSVGIKNVQQTSFSSTSPTSNVTIPNAPVNDGDNTRSYIAAATGGICGLLCLIFLILVIYHCKSKTKIKRFKSVLHRRHVKNKGTTTIPNVNLDDTIRAISNSDLSCRSTEFLTLATSDNVEYARVKKIKPKPDVCDVLNEETPKSKTTRAPRQPPDIDKDKNVEMYYMDGSQIYNKLHEDLNEAIGKRRMKRETEEEQNIYNKLKESEYSTPNTKNEKPANVLSNEYGKIPERRSKNVPDEYGRNDIAKKV